MASEAPEVTEPLYSVAIVPVSASNSVCAALESIHASYLHESSYLNCLSYLSYRAYLH